MAENQTAPPPPRIVAFFADARLQVLFATLTLCLIIVFSASVFLYRPYDGMALITSYGGEVSAIYVPSPAYNAGIQVGDHILAVNNQPVDAWLQRPLYPAGLKEGDQVIYQVERNGTLLTIPMKLGSYWSNTQLLAAIIGSIILSVAFWSIGLFLCLFAPFHDIRARLIGFCWLLAGIAASAGGPGTQSHFWIAGTTLKVSWAILGFAVIAANLYFPFPTFSSRRRSLIINSTAAIAAMIIVANILDDSFLKPANQSLTNYGLPTNRLVYAWFLGATIISIFLLLRSRFRSQDAEVRRQTGIILWAMLIGFGPFFLLTLIPLLLLGDQAPAADGAYTSLFLAIIPLAYAYVIHQRRLLRIDAIINRMVVFFILMMGILISSFAILGLLAVLLNLPPQYPVFGSLAAGLVALPSTILEKKVRMQVNRVLYGTYYDHATVTTSLSSELARTMDRKSLNTLLTERLCAQMGIQKAALYLIAELALHPQSNGSELPVLPLEDELCKTLFASGQPVRGLNLWALLSATAQQRWKDLEWGQLFIPIIFQEEMVGLLILGGRPSGDLYSAQDIAILGTVAHQSALAVTNIQLVDSLRGLNRRLVYSEDERRKTIANMLHDSILQDLFVIKQRVSKLPNGKALEDDFAVVFQQLRATIEEQRPCLLNNSLPLALEALTRDMDSIAGEKGPHMIWCSQIPDEVKISDPQATFIYRIAQEALMNALKHSQASLVEIRLEYNSPNDLELRIQDDGVGLKDSSLVRGDSDPHFGLTIMRERAEMIHAQSFNDKLEIHIDDN